VIVAQSQTKTAVWTPAHAAARRLSWRKRLAVLVQELLPLLVAIVFFAPFLIMLSTSFKTAADAFRFPPQLWPHPWTVANYRRAVEAMPFLRYLGNTLLIAGLAVIGTLFSSPLVAYALAKIRWRGRSALFILILSTMMLPPQVTMIPIYILWNKTPFMGTYWPLIVPNFLGSAFFIFLLRQFFMGLPNDLLDAARLDGASELRIYAGIVLPLARPALATVAIFTFVWAWADFLNPLIYLNDPQMYTLSIGLYSFFSEHGIEWGPLMAACAIFSLPLILLFMVAQRQFLEGISLTGLK
jgi:multiple sugar transport system permease protein